MPAKKIPCNEDPEKILRDIDCFALDLDGTVYLGEQWIDGALEFLKAIDEAGKRYIFMTNNSSRSSDEYLEKIRRMGLDLGEDRLVTSGQAAIRLLQREYEGKTVFLMGNPSLAREFLEVGIELEDKHPDMVVTAFDTTLTYSRLCKVCNFLREGMPFVATHPDINCPTETGFVPDIGSFHALIETSCGRKPDRVVGKPNSEIVGVMLEKSGAKAENTAVIGDRLYTDVAAGVCNGLAGILVLSGESKLKDVKASKIKPNLIFDSVKEIIPYLR